MEAFYCYILECSDGSYYTGWTSDPSRRLKEHAAGRGAKYTRSRRPLALVYLEPLTSRREAMQREAALKKFTRDRKKALVKTMDAEQLQRAEEGMLNG